MAAPAVPRQRAFRTKSRLGCVQCKRRHVKCDEARPVCGRCAAARSDCSLQALTASLPGQHQAVHLQHRTTPSSPASSTSTALPRRESSKAPSKSDDNDPDSSTHNAPPQLISTSPRPHCDTQLTRLEAAYFDVFRRRTVHNMVVQGQSLDLWTRVVPREGMRNPCIRACILSLGALDCARHQAAKAALEHPSEVELPLCALDSPARFGVHRNRATQYYIQALAHMRNLLADPKSVGAKARTILIASILFVAYEALQGNMSTVDQLLSTAILALKGRLSGLAAAGTISPSESNDPRFCSSDSRTTSESGRDSPAICGEQAGHAESHTERTPREPSARRKKTQIAQTVDDAGVEEAEFYLPRIAVIRGVCAPNYPAFPSPQLEDIWSVPLTLREPVPELTATLPEMIRAYEKSMTAVTTWFFAMHRNIVMELRQPTQQALDEQNRLVAFHQCWLDLTKHKLAQVKNAIVTTDTNDTATLQNLQMQRRMLLIFHIGSHLATVHCQAATDPTERLWDVLVDRCRESCTLMENVVDELEFNADGSPQQIMLKKIFDDQLLPIVYGITARCRIRDVRQRGFALFRRLVHRHGSEWEAKTMVIRQEALCNLEEAGRDEHTGDIPVSKRYLWMSARWAEDYRSLKVTVKNMESRMDEVVVVNGGGEFDRLVGRKGATTSRSEDLPSALHGTSVSA